MVQGILDVLSFLAWAVVAVVVAIVVTAQVRYWLWQRRQR